MFCPNCGIETGEVRFCRACGTNLSVVSNLLEREDPSRLRTTALRGKTTLGLFSSTHLYNDKDLNGHTALSVFSGVRIDFTTAPLAYGETKITVIAVFGGVDILVPDDVAIRVTGTSIFGGVEVLKRGTGGIFSSNKYETPGYDQAPRRLHIDATSIFGGANVKRRKKKSSQGPEDR